MSGFDQPPGHIVKPPGPMVNWKGEAYKEPDAGELKIREKNFVAVHQTRPQRNGGGRETSGKLTDFEVSHPVYEIDETLAGYTPSAAPVRYWRNAGKGCYRGHKASILPKTVPSPSGVRERRWESIELDQCSARSALQLLLEL
jgi:hypothetical protein